MSRWRQAAGRLRAGAGIGAGVATLLAGLSTGAHGADRATPTPHDATHLPSFGTWAGGYIGWQGSAGDAFGGFGFGSGMISRRSVPNSAPGMPRAAMMPAAMRPTALGGLFGGYAWQIGPFVYGVEADVDATNLKRPVSSTTPGFGFEGLDPAFPVIRAKADVFGTARARVGYAFERYLVYASFGLAGAQVRFLTNFLDPGRRQPRPFGGAAPSSGSRSVPASSMPSPRTSRWDWNTATSTSAGADGSISAPFGRHRRPLLRAGLLHLQPSPRAPVLVSGWSRLAARARRGSPPRSRYGDQRPRLAARPDDLRGPGRVRLPLALSRAAEPRAAPGTRHADGDRLPRFKLTDSTELYYNPEFDQGFGLSRTLGVAGFVNGEAQKAGAPFPKFRSQRYFVRRPSASAARPRMCRTARTRSRRVATSSGSRSWRQVRARRLLRRQHLRARSPRRFPELVPLGVRAYDFPANLPGFTQGVMVEYNRKAFAIRAAYTQVPKEPSSNVLDPRIARKGGLTVELEERHVLPGLDQPARSASACSPTSPARRTIASGRPHSRGLLRRHQRCGRGHPTRPAQERALPQPRTGGDIAIRVFARGPA